MFYNFCCLLQEKTGNNVSLTIFFATHLQCLANLYQSITINHYSASVSTLSKNNLCEIDNLSNIFVHFFRMIRLYQRMFGGQWSSLWRKQSPLRLHIVFSCARGQCGEMEMVVNMQSVRVVMQRGSQKVVRNWHLMKKGKWDVIMSFIIWWTSIIFGGAKRKRSMA